MTTTTPITLRLRKGSDWLKALVAAVNQGIDAHLEAVTQSEFKDCGSVFQADIHINDCDVLIRRLTEAGDNAALEVATMIRDRMSLDMDEFTAAYIEAALWTSTFDADGDRGTPLEDNYGPEDLSQDALASIKADCRDFQQANGIPGYGDSRYSDAEKAGHDFWLTRNGHGCGFWDRDELSEEVQKKYTQAAKAYGSSDIYVGDDGKLYVS